ncbi:MAG: PorT family protein [Lewinellaceae bacterium]|nr:PorT family protein [Lewinellaceae bacterium]
MKNSVKFLLTAAFALVTFAASAQISIGPRVGVNLAKWSGGEEEIGDVKNRTGYQFGIAAEIRLNDNFAIQPEVNFLQKGARQDFSEVDSIFGKVESKTDISMNYLEVPVLLKAGTSFGPARVDILAGPSFGYALSGKVKDELTINGETETDKYDIDFEDDEVKRTDLGLQLGAAFSVNLGERASLFVDGRYLLGLTNLNDSEDDDFSIKNRGISLSAGVLFRL